LNFGNHELRKGKCSMAFDLSSISNETRLRAPRILLLGVEKIGKSTFAADASNPIFIPINGEEGVDDIKLPKFVSGETVPQFPVCSHLNEVFECLNTLWNTEHEYQTVVIDSASSLEPIIWQKCCEDNNVKSISDVQGGYNKGREIVAVENWRLMTQYLDALRTTKNMSSIIIGHVKVKRFDDPTAGSFDTYEFAVDKFAAALFYQWADAILFVNTKTVVTKEDIGFNKEAKRGIDISMEQRYLYTQKRPAHPGGGRGSFGQLPYEIPIPKDAPMSLWIDAIAAIS